MELSADPRYFHGLRQFSFPLILRQWKSRRPTRGGGAIVMELQIGGAQIGGVQIGGLGDAAQDILVVQQVLPKSFGKAHGFLIQGTANLIAVHDITFCSIARVRSSCFSVIVRGGEKAIT